MHVILYPTGGTSRASTVTTRSVTTSLAEVLDAAPHLAGVELLRDTEGADENGVFRSRVQLFNGVQHSERIPHTWGEYLVEVDVATILAESMQLDMSRYEDDERIAKYDCSTTRSTIAQRFEHLHWERECGGFLRRSDRARLRLYGTITGMRSSQLKRGETLLGCAYHKKHAHVRDVNGRQRGEYISYKRGRVGVAQDILFEVALALNREELQRVQAAVRAISYDVSDASKEVELWRGTQRETETLVNLQHALIVTQALQELLRFTQDMVVAAEQAEACRRW
ncbi:hypothetical protein PHYBOEH_008354 [Phytophthora boehmeriae]|uniref:Uncharacterized protein n=1 Tax=Phytophthora boehmeriae TaxID=109152 RepID=A0A8T1W4T1_9STRA|nr:hypothetical protein PHYBOEH_008354 [Phytophthora boehmeriae]